MVEDPAKQGVSFTICIIRTFVIPIANQKGLIANTWNIKVGKDLGFWSVEGNVDIMSTDGEKDHEVLISF